MPEDSKPNENPSGFVVNFYSFLEDDILIEPIELSFEIYDSQMEELIYSRQLPILQGMIPSRYGYVATIPWEQTGLENHPPGDYYIVVKKPSEIAYTVADSREEKKTDVSRAMGCNLELFRMTIY